MFIVSRSIHARFTYANFVSFEILKIFCSTKVNSASILVPCLSNIVWILLLIFVFAYYFINPLSPGINLHILLTSLLILLIYDIVFDITDSDWLKQHDLLEYRCTASYMYSVMPLTQMKNGRPISEFFPWFLFWLRQWALSWKWAVSFNGFGRCFCK